MNYNFIWNPEEGIAICEIKYKNLTFTGKSKCHNGDRDFMSENTGCYIAESRASIKLNKFIKNHEILPALKALKHLQARILSSKYYNEKSYESQSLAAEIQNLEKRLSEYNSIISQEKQYLKDYIKNKDIVYTKLRNRSEKAKSN